MSDDEKLLAGFEDWLVKWERLMGEKHVFHDILALAKRGIRSTPITSAAGERKP